MREREREREREIIVITYLIPLYHLLNTDSRSNMKSMHDELSLDRVC